MGKARLNQLLWVLTVAAVGCAPVLAGPELPRPAITAMTAPPAVATGPTSGTTTTTVDPAEALAMECPERFCLVYDLAADATWSDGTAVTGEDFVRTYQAAASRQPNDRDPGYDLISSIDLIDETRVRVVFDRPYGPWRSLFSRLIGPEDATSGPFQIVDRVPGDRIVLERVDGWWPETDPMSGAPLGDVAEIQFVYIDGISEMVDALEDGEIDVMVARADAGSLEALSQLENVEYTVTPGRFWEHIDFHHEDPILAQPWAREAIASAIDREEIIDQTVRVLQPDALALDNTLFMTRTRPYESHYDEDYDPAAAEQILVDNGCERGSSGIYTCGGIPMSFVWATTSDDPARRNAFDIVSEDLAEIGIEVVGDFRTPSAFVSSDFLLGGPDQWQLANFAWRAGDEPSDTEARYECGDSLFNVNRYCSPEIEALFVEAEGTLDTDTRQDMYNAADRLYLDAIAAVPLYQKPELMAWTTDLTGPVANHSSSSDLWNVAAWAGKDSIVVALPVEPGTLDPFLATDDNANRVLATVMYGALGMDPSLAPLHVLVDSVTVVEG